MTSEVASWHRLLIGPTAFTGVVDDAAGVCRAGAIAARRYQTTPSAGDAPAGNAAHTGSQRGRKNLVLRLVTWLPALKGE